MTLTQTNSIWLKLIHSHLTLWGSHLEFCHLEFGYLVFSHLSFSFQTHSYLPKLVPTFAQKNFTYLFWLNWMMVAILNSVMLIQTTAILDLTPCIFSQISLKNTLTPLWLWLKEFILNNLMMAAILYSAILNSAILYSGILYMLDSDTWLSSLRFTQKQSHSNLTLTQTNSIWLKLIYSHLTWWWQPSWILPSWICLSWIQPS